jgi:hypothetical protein
MEKRRAERYKSLMGAAAAVGRGGLQTLHARQLKSCSTNTSVKSVPHPLRLSDPQVLGKTASEGPQLQRLPINARSLDTCQTYLQTNATPLELLMMYGDSLFTVACAGDPGSRKGNVS